MAYIVSLEGFTPGPRFDAVPFNRGRVQESLSSATGPWTTLATVTLSPLDADPSNPQQRDFTVTSAVASGWYRVKWLDASDNEQDSAAVFSDQSTYQTTGVPFSALVSRLRGMTAVTESEAKARINQAYRQMVADAEAIKSRITFGPTVVGQADYEIDPRVIAIRTLRVGGYAYDRQAIDDLDDLVANDAWVRGAYRGFFAPNFSAGANPEVTIYPVPTADGVTMTARASLLPDDMIEDGEYPKLPADFHEDLVDGAMATVLRRDDERLGDSQALEARFKERIRELHGRLNRRVGGGPARVKLVR